MAHANVSPETEILVDVLGQLVRELTDRIEALEARPVLRYLGTWTRGVRYEEASAVSYDGSVWIALAATDAKPGEPSSNWQLACGQARRRDGRDSVAAPNPEQRVRTGRDRA
jgi:hypothetical protein